MSRSVQHDRLTSAICALLAVFSLVLILVAFRTAVMELFAAWQTNEYSHGIIVPFIALLLAWHQLTLYRPVLKPSWKGFFWLIVAALLLLCGTLAAFESAAEYGLIISFIGLSLAFLGKRATRVMAPAFLYLFFAVPLPHIVHSTLSQDLQLISSTLGVWCLDLLGIPVFQEGNIIDLGGFKLQVAEACSGLRYLFPLMSFGYLVAYLLKDSWWKRLTVFFSVIPITIIMNSLRIALIGVTVNLWGIGMAEGFLHEFEGWVIFLLCTLLLMGEVFLLLQVGRHGTFRYDYLGPARGPLHTGILPIKGPMVGALAFAGLIAFTFDTDAIDQRAEIEPAHPPFFSFPMTLEQWQGRQQSLEPDVLLGLDLSDYWLADYRRGKDSVNFYMAYYARQHVGSEAHSPSNCIPGGGWQIVSEQVRSITLQDGTALNVTRLMIRKAGVVQLVYYWFDERGRNITDTYQAKWYLLQDALMLHRTDGGLVRLVTPIADGEREEAGDKRLRGFLSLAYPSILTFIPGGAAEDIMLKPRPEPGAASATGVQDRRL